MLIDSIVRKLGLSSAFRYIAARIVYNTEAGFGPLPLPF